MYFVEILLSTHAAVVNIPTGLGYIIGYIEGTTGPIHVHCVVTVAGMLLRCITNHVPIPVIKHNRHVYVSKVLLMNLQLYAISLYIYQIGHPYHYHQL